MIRVNRFVRCPFSQAIEFADAVLQGIRVGGHMAAHLSDDRTDIARRHEALEFRWDPKLRIFPSARALLTVRPHAPQGTELQLSIVYRPPFGAAGGAFDAVLGKHIASLSARLLLTDLQRGIERARAKR
jgi:hypothetical protein